MKSFRTTLAAVVAAALLLAAAASTSAFALGPCPCGDDCPCAKAPTPAKYSGKVVEVSDGDTIKLLIVVRLGEVDCPEVAHNSKEQDQPYGPESRKFTEDHALNKRVSILTTGKPDRYGRMVGEVIIPDYGSLNRGLVSEGYAHWYGAYSKDLTLKAAEDRAREGRLGLWADRKPIAPWDWRKSGR